MARREFKGSAKAAALTAQISPTDVTATLTLSTGWPTGGANGKFAVVFDRDEATEEHAYASSRSGNVLTFASAADRGIDDTTAATHPAGATVEHGVFADDIDEPNAHINDTGLDHHTQYLNTTRHAAVTHTASMLGTDSVGSDEIAAGAVGASELADNAVDTAAIQALAVTAAKIANDTITATQIAANAITSSELADDSVDSAAIADGAINTLAYFASPTAPVIVQAAAPAQSDGRLWVDTDDGSLNISDGSAFLPPWNVPWGILGTRQKLTANSATYNPNDTTDITVTVTARSDRLYTVNISQQAFVSAVAEWQLQLLVDTVLTDRLDYFDVQSGMDQNPTHASILWEPTAGSKVLAVKVVRDSGAGTIGFQRSATNAGWFWVEDIGPR